MVNQFSNNLECAFFLFVQYKSQQFAQSYFNATYPLYYIADNRLPSSVIRYSSPFRSLVYDSGVSGAMVMQAISGGSNVYDRSSGLNIDYLNGGVIVPSSWGTGLSLSGTASYNEINFFPAGDEQTILTQEKFFRNPNYIYGATGALQPYVYATPAVFVNTLHQETDAYAIGGLITSTMNFSLAVFAESNFQLNALMSIYSDCKYQYFPMINAVNWPLNGYGDLKSGQGGYNYATMCKQWGTPGNLVYIKDVKTSKVSDKVQQNPLYYVGLIDMDVQFIRQAPLGTNVFT